jgi:DNA primase
MDLIDTQFIGLVSTKLQKFSKKKNYTTSTPEFEFDKPDFSNRKQPQKINLPKASENVTAKKYLEGRKLPSDKFYFAEKFKEFSNSLTDTFDSLNGDHPRIVIPFYDSNNYLIGFQGRSIDQRDKPKYLTVMVDKNAPKIYGLNEVDLDLPVYITEGPFDSLFLKNSIAMAGADIDLQFIKKRHNTKFIFVLDNEPRNKEIVDRYNKLISMDQHVVIWPNHITDKDLNDMVLSGHDVQSVVELNTYSKLEAQLKFSQWKKI